MSELSRSDQKRLINLVRDHRMFIEEHKATKEQKINFWKKHIRQALTQEVEPERSFLEDLYRKELALLDGSFDVEYFIKKESSLVEKDDTITEYNLLTKSYILLLEDLGIIKHLCDKFNLSLNNDTDRERLSKIIQLLINVKKSANDKTIDRYLRFIPAYRQNPSKSEFPLKEINKVKKLIDEI